MIQEISTVCISPESSLREAIARIDHNTKGIVLVTDEDGRLIGTITDGDVRRAVLRGENLDSPVSRLLEKKDESQYPKPVTAPIECAHEELLHLMQETGVHQIPLIDKKGTVSDLITMDELLPNEVLPIQAVIMAGGYGKRLLPLTEETPKPMLSVGDRPLMEVIIDRLRQSGIHRINVTTHYKPEKISEHFGDGEDFGVDINYVTEDRPLGTAGGLGLLKCQDEPFLVINGDVLTKVDFKAFHAYHREHKADMTVAVKKYDLNVPYGVIESNDGFVKKVDEKPCLSFFVNAGVYLIEPSVCKDITGDKRFEMTDLINRLVDDGRPVACFPILEYWLDIGEHGDYSRAQDDVSSGKVEA